MTYLPARDTAMVLILLVPSLQLSAQAPLVDTAPGVSIPADTTFVVSGDNLFFSTWGQVYSYDLSDPSAQPVPQLDHDVRVAGEASLKTGPDGTAAAETDANLWHISPRIDHPSFITRALAKDVTATGQGFFWRHQDGLWGRLAGGDNEFLTPDRLLSRSDNHVIWNVPINNRWIVWLSDGTYPGTVSLGVFDRRLSLWSEIEGVIYLSALGSAHENLLFYRLRPGKLPTFVGSSPSTGVVEVREVGNTFYWLVKEPTSVGRDTSRVTLDLWALEPGSLPIHIATLCDDGCGVHPTAGNLAALDGHLCFAKRDPNTGRELWCTGGTPQTTALKTDFAPGPADGMLTGSLASLNGRLVYFSEDAEGTFLVSSDGTTEGSRRLPTFEGLLNPTFRWFGGRVFIFGSKLWSTDGQTLNELYTWKLKGYRYLQTWNDDVVIEDAGEILRLKENGETQTIRPLPPADSLSASIKTCRGLGFISTRDGLWVSSGTPATTRKIFDQGRLSQCLKRGVSIVRDLELIVVTREALAAALKDSPAPVEQRVLGEFINPFMFDLKGSTYLASSELNPGIFRVEAERLVKVHDPLEFNSFDSWIIEVGGRTFISYLGSPLEFLGPYRGFEPADFPPGLTAMGPVGTRYLFLEGHLRFLSYEPGQGFIPLPQLDGAAGPPNQFHFPGLLGYWDNTALVASGGAIWITDGTIEGTYKSLDLPSIEPFSEVRYSGFQVGPRILVTRRVSKELRVPRYAELTVFEYDPEAHTLTQVLQKWSPVNETIAQGPTGLYFSALGLASGRELWFTDGTTSGTRLVDDTNPGVLSSKPGWLVAANRHLFFMARGPQLGWEPHAVWFADIFSSGFEEGELIAWSQTPREGRPGTHETRGTNWSQPSATVLRHSLGLAP